MNFLRNILVLVFVGLLAACGGGDGDKENVSHLTVTKYVGYSDQIVVAGTANVRIGSATFTADATGNLLVSPIEVNLPPAVLGSVTNLILRDRMTGTLLGTAIGIPGEKNKFGVSLTLHAGSSKTIGIYADILPGISVGAAIVATIGIGTTSTETGGLPSAINEAVALQTITIGHNILTVTRGVGDPASSNVLAGASSVFVGQFSFASANSASTIRNLTILVPSDAATSVTEVALMYKDVNGAMQMAVQPLAISPNAPYTKAAFTGLTMYVPLNDSANLSVHVGTATIASGAMSGAAINVSLDAESGSFLATDSSGTSVSTIHGGVNLAAGGTFYVRKSIPTFNMLSTSASVPVTGAPLYEFSVSADPAGAIEWSKRVFNIAVSGQTTVVSRVYLTDSASGNSLIDGTVDPVAGTITFDLLKNTSAAQYAQVPAGATKTYVLYGVVTGFTTGSTVTISMASDTTSVANAPASLVSGNTVWSDRSAVSHTIGTNDWTNGYLLRDFTRSTTNYSK